MAITLSVKKLKQGYIDKILHTSLSLFLILKVTSAGEAGSIPNRYQCEEVYASCFYANSEPQPSTSDLRQQIYSLQEQSFTEREAGHYSQAIALLQQALALAQKLGDLDAQWWAQNDLAETYKDAGNLAQAVQLHQKNLEFVRQNSQYFGTRPYSQETQSLVYLSKVYTLQKKYSQSIALLKQALSIENQLKAPEKSAIRGTVLQELGINLFLMGNLKEAESTLLSAAQTYENARQSQTNASSIGQEYELEIELKRWLQQIWVAQNRSREALELAEQNRAREFVALIANRLGVKSGIQNAIQSPNLEQIKQIAKVENATLVEYSITYEYNSDWQLSYKKEAELKATNLFIWVIKPTGEIAFRRQSLNNQQISLTELVRQTRESLGARGIAVVNNITYRSQPKPKSPSHQLQQLEQLLIQPIAELLPTNPNARVVFIPQDFLFLVPFPALQDANGHYLIEKHTIIQSPSIQVLALTRQQQQQIANSVKGVLIVGNPTMPPSLPQLPGAEQEAKAVAQLFHSQALTGNQATKAAVLQQLKTARIVHLATHGLLDDAFGAFSSIALAPTATDKGFLSAREIVSLKINSELVVLSACNTGRGKINGDGVLGLSRSFLAAGVPSLIGSLWSVPDTPTASLMTSFYQEIKQGKDKAQALRQAMLKTKQSFPEPINWAAFTLIGQANSSPQLATATGGVTLATQTTPKNYYTVLPVPENVTNYFETPSPIFKGEVDISYRTNLSVEELVSFYRQAFQAKGWPEDTRYTDISPERWLMIFVDAPNHRKVVIQANTGPVNQWGVFLRFEPTRY